MRLTPAVRRGHHGAMRTHRTILSDFGSGPQLADRLALSLNTVGSWRQRDSIPARHWRALEALGVATVDELAGAAARAARDETRPQAPD